MMLLGIDSGGTSCRLALCGGAGRVLSQVTVPGHNPNADGFPALEASFRRGLDALLAPFGGREAAIDALHGGIAGGEGDNRPRLEQMLRALLPRCPRVSVSSDALIALSAGLGAADGGVLIAGTGTIGFVRKKNALLRFGGWGYLADEGGSGWHIGRDGFRAAMAGEDAGLPPTALTALYEEKLGMNMMAAVTALYRGELSLAACAPLVFSAGEAGDQAALDILRRNAAILAETLGRMQRAFGAPLPVVLVGGLLSPGSRYLAELEGCCRDIPVRLFHPSLSPLLGAVRMAAHAAGAEETEDFLANLALPPETALDLRK